MKVENEPWEEDGFKGEGRKEGKKNSLNTKESKISDVCKQNTSALGNFKTET